VRGEDGNLGGKNSEISMKEEIRRKIGLRISVENREKGEDLKRQGILRHDAKCRISKTKDFVLERGKVGKGGEQLLNVRKDGR